MIEHRQVMDLAAMSRGVLNTDNTSLPLATSTAATPASSRPAVSGTKQPAKKRKKAYSGTFECEGPPRARGLPIDVQTSPPHLAPPPFLATFAP